jgi:2-methylcitrate dehydratase PrpD
VSQSARPAAPLTVQLVREMWRLDAALLDRAVLHKAELCVLDLLSCMFAGSTLPSARQAVAAARRWPCADGAAVVGAGVRVAPAEAAFANSVQAVSAARTDMHAATTSHVGAVAIPAALACATLRPIAGSEWLAALVAAYEAHARVGRLIVNDRFMQHHRATSVVGSVSGAIAAARVLGLDEIEAVHALSLSVNTAAGLMEWGHVGSNDLLYQPAWASRNATAAALLAAQGASASLSILEGPGGLLAAFGDRKRAGQMLEPFGATPEIMRVEFKAVPACVFVQAAAFACEQAARVLGTIDPTQVVSIELATYGSALRYPGCDDPGPIACIQQARMSLQFTAAAVLAQGAVNDAAYAQFADARTVALLPKVQLHESEVFSNTYPARQGAEVVVTLADGRRTVGRVEQVPVVTESRVRERFLRSAEPVVGPARAQAIEAACLSLKDAPSLASLLSLLG